MRLKTLVLERKMPWERITEVLQIAKEAEDRKI